MYDYERKKRYRWTAGVSERIRIFDGKAVFAGEERECQSKKELSETLGLSAVEEYFLAWLGDITT